MWVSVCTRQTGNATIQVHDWVHDSPVKLSYWKHPQCVCVLWCVRESHAQVPAAGETGDAEDGRPVTWVDCAQAQLPEGSPLHIYICMYFPLTDLHLGWPERETG